MGNDKEMTKQKLYKDDYILLEKTFKFCPKQNPKINSNLLKKHLITHQDFD